MEQKHDWFTAAVDFERGWESCRKCGVIRRKDGRPDSQCRGPVSVSLRGRSWWRTES